MPEFLGTKFKNSNHLCEKILEDTGVALLPGSDFGFEPKKKKLTKMAISITTNTCRLFLCL